MMVFSYSSISTFKVHPIVFFFLKTIIAIITFLHWQVLDEVILEKPKDKEDAYSMLKR